MVVGTRPQFQKPPEADIKEELRDSTLLYVEASGCQQIKIAYQCKLTGFGGLLGWLFVVDLWVVFFPTRSNLTHFFFLLSRPSN